MISLIGFSEKSWGNPKGGGEMKEIPYRAELKKLYDEKILRISLISFIEKIICKFQRHRISSLWALSKNLGSVLKDFPY